LDAILFANDSIGFRATSLRYLVIVTGAGVHERSDGTGCSDVNLDDLRQSIGANALVVILSPYSTSLAGVAPDDVTGALGGLFVNVGLLALLELNPSAYSTMLPLFDGSSLASVGFTPPDNSDNAPAARLTFDTGDLRFSQDFQASD
jgi:hypothetical protein